MDNLIRLLTVVALVFINAFFVAAEFALVSIRRTRVEQLVSEGSRAARLIMRAKDDPNGFISAAQLGITMASLALGWLGEETVARLLETAFPLRSLPEPFATMSVHSLAITVAFLLITFMHIVLGEQVPKMVALRHDTAVALWTVWPVEAFRWIGAPFITLLSGATNGVLKLLGIKSLGEQGASVHSAEELELMVQASHQAGAIQDIERELMTEVFDFGELTVGQVMVPRRDIQALRVDATLEDVISLASKSPHTRFPVYDGTMDNIDNVVGTIHLREVLLGMRGGKTGFDLRSIVHPPLLIPESASMEHALREFRRAEARIAIVFDEYGGTAGLVSVGDLVAEIFGRIGDEFHHEEPEIQPQADGSALLNPRLLLSEFNERFGHKLESEEIDTLGGYVMEQLGRMARPGDAVELESGSIRVEAVDGVRITLLRHVPLAQARKPGARSADEDKPG